MRGCMGGSEGDIRAMSQGAFIARVYADFTKIYTCARCNFIDD